MPHSADGNRRQDAFDPAVSYRTGRAIYRALYAAVECLAAVLLVVEILILSAGVCSRYAFNRPLLWSDELASILFLWLVMLGAVMALQRGEHMRLTTVLRVVPPRQRRFLESVVLLTVAAFMLFIIFPASHYVSDEASGVTPVLEISEAWRESALMVGIVLMAAVAIAQLITDASFKEIGWAALPIVGITVILVAAKPILLGMGNVNLLVFFVALLGLCVAVSLPIGFAFGISTLSYLALMTRAPLDVMISRMSGGMSLVILLAVPLFVVLGKLIEITGMARAMVDLIASVIGHFRGGLQVVLLVAMYLVSGISGSKAADMAAVVPVLFPEMKKRGAEPGELVALLSASGAMTETIPPSLVLITIGSVTNVSIAALFTGGLLPAAVVGVALMVLAIFRSRGDDLSNVKRSTPREIFGKLLVALPALVLPFLIRGAVVEGVATATEVATVGIAYTILAALLLRSRVNWHALYPLLVDTVVMTGSVVIIVGFATTMGWCLIQSGIAANLVAIMRALPGHGFGFIALSIVIFIVLGSVLEGIPSLVLLGPLLFPIARSLGVNEVHYAMVVILAMGVGLFAPPFGVGFYSSCAIGQVDPDVAIFRVWPYLGVVVAALIAVAVTPWLSTGFL